MSTFVKASATFRFAVTPSQHCSGSSNCFCQSKTLNRRSFVLHGKSCGFVSMYCAKNTFRVNDKTTTNLGDFQPQQSYEFGFLLVLVLPLEFRPKPDDRATLGHLRECQEIGQQGAALPSNRNLSCWRMTHHNAPVARVDSNP